MAPHGVYFVAGNHEQFGDDSKYLHAIAAAGVRVLSNEKVEVDGLQIVGVPYRNAAQGSHFTSVLEGIRLDRNRASILLTHAPDHPEIAEAAGVSLQLSGHTHLGPIHTLELDGAADLPPICLRLKSDWEDAGFHFKRSRNLGTASATRIESRNCGASLPVTFTCFGILGKSTANFRAPIVHGQTGSDPVREPRL